MEHLALEKEDIVWFQMFSLQVCVNIAFYGIQIVMSAAAIRTILRRESQSHRLIMAIVVLVLCSTLGFASSTTYGFRIILRYKSGTDGFPSRLEVAVDLLTVLSARCSYVVDIGVVVWRAWLLHSESRRVKYVLATCMLAIVVGAVVDFGMIAWKPLMSRPTVLTLAWAAPLLFTNIVATSLVGTRAWTYRRSIKANLQRLRQKSDVEKALAVLLETGSIFCSIWIVYIALAASNDNKVANAIDVILPEYRAFSGIYPTLVILVVALQRSESESLLETQLSRVIHFTDAHGVTTCRTSITSNVAATTTTAENT